MALDSASKRFSMMNLGTALIIPLFIPDGTIDAGDKYHLLNLYYGITLDLPIVEPLQPAGYLSIINTNGEGVASVITISQGLQSAIDSSEGNDSIISDSLGVFSSITEDGKGV